ncbi:MAG: metal-sensitive transcriptional regulator [Massilia sp.]
MADQSLNMIAGTALSTVQKKDLLHRLARIEGQLRGVQKLIALADEPADCEGVAQQMAAARKALDRAFVQLLSASIITQTANASELGEAQTAAASLAAMLDKFA